MKRCEEFFYENIVRLYPLIKGTMKHLVPETVRKDEVVLSEIRQGDGTAFADMDALRTWLGAKARFTEWETDETLPLVLEQPVQIKVQRNADINGYTHALTIALELKEYGATEKAMVRQIERTGHDFVAEHEDGRLSLLRLFEPAQKIEVSSAVGGDSYGATLTVKMKNVNGIQEIVDRSSGSSSSE